MNDEDSPNMWDVLMKEDQSKNAELASLRAELAAMTARKDRWRRAALKYRDDRNEHIDSLTMYHFGVSEERDPTPDEYTTARQLSIVSYSMQRRWERTENPNSDERKPDSAS